MESTTSTCATLGGGESGAGAPAVRPQRVEVRVERRVSSDERREQHVKVRVEKSQLGEACWRTGRPRERREW